MSGRSVPDAGRGCGSSLVRVESAALVPMGPWASRSCSGPGTAWVDSWISSPPALVEMATGFSLEIHSSDAMPGPGPLPTARHLDDKSVHPCVVLGRKGPERGPMRVRPTAGSGVVRFPARRTVYPHGVSEMRTRPRHPTDGPGAGRARVTAWEPLAFRTGPRGWLSPTRTTGGRGTPRGMVHPGEASQHRRRGQ